MGLLNERRFFICYLSVIMLGGETPDTDWLKERLDYYFHNPVQRPIEIWATSRTQAISIMVNGARQFLAARRLHPPSLTPDKQFYMGLYERFSDWQCVAIVEANREGQVIWRKHPIPLLTLPLSSSPA